MDLEDLFKPFLEDSPEAAVPPEKVRVQSCPLTEDASREVLRRVAESLRPGAWAETLAWADVAFRRGFHGHWAFDDFRRPSERVVVVPEGAHPAELWFLGDLHGDLLALEMALLHIEQETQEGTAPTLVLLGDLVDDGPHGYPVFLRVLQEGARRPCRIALIAGNHDEAQAIQDGVFSSSVDPSEFSEWLDEHRELPGVRRGGELFIELFAQAPRALFLGEGLFAAHGGIPHTDLHGELRTRADLERPECLQDFVWTRAAARAPKKLPNRSSRGCQFGHQDFDAFCALAQELLERPVNHLLRAHDHIEERFDLHPPYQVNALTTLNTLGHRLGREVSGPYSRNPCVARKRAGEILEIHRLVLDERYLNEVYPEPAG